jgi:uncharacterized protein (TIGR03437 family)
VTAFRPEAFPAARIAGIANAAGGPVGSEVAPGELVSIYGSDIGPETEASADPRPGELAPEELGGVRVQFGGVAARLLYVSRNQINAIVPNALSPGSTVEARVGEAALTVHVMAAAPRIFRNAEGMAAAVNEDGTLNSASNPAAPGSIVAVWVTGTGAGDRPDGTVATAARDSGCCGARLNGAPVEVVYAGDAPGIVTAVTQVNVRLPGTLTDIAPGLTVSAGAAESDPAPVWVRTSGP